jgi:hypothetical protein
MPASCTNRIRSALSVKSDIYESLGIPRLQACFQTLCAGENPPTQGRLDPRDKSFFIPAFTFSWFLSMEDKILSLLPHTIGAFATETGTDLPRAILRSMLRGDDADVSKAYWEWEATIGDMITDAELHHLVFKIRCATNFAFIMTASGYMGLAPRWTQVGDQICVLPGCRVPVILRYAEGCYSLVGACFVLGLMDGELLEDSDWEARLRDFEIV